MIHADPYRVLGLTAAASDEEIRARYLSLVQQFPPEQHPARFAVLRRAYDMLQDFDSRVRLRIFPSAELDSLEAISEELACRSERPRIGLNALTAMLAMLPR